MYGRIYKATGPTGKLYIGQTTQTLAKRKAAHAYRAKHGDKRTVFQLALLELGFKNFQWEQIDTAESKDELNQREKFWIAHFKADNPDHGYNHTEGGIKTVYTPEARRKISEAMKGKPNGREGTHHTDETRRKISEANTGKHHTPEVCQKISKAKKDKRLSPETRQKMSEARKGEKHHFYGKQFSEEYRRKLSEAHIGKQRDNNNSHAKLTEADARQIKTDLQNGMRINDIAIKHNVSYGIVKSIKYGKAWTWLNSA
jgi:group I intron endonuclease